MNGFNPMNNMSMGMPGQGGPPGGFNPMSNMGMSMPPQQGGAPGGGPDLMKMLMLMMMMSGDKGFNPYVKETGAVSGAKAYRKIQNLGSMIAMSMMGIPGLG